MSSLRGPHVVYRRSLYPVLNFMPRPFDGGYFDEQNNPDVLIPFIFPSERCRKSNLDLSTRLGSLPTH